MAERDCGTERGPSAPRSEAKPMRMGSSHGLRQSNVNHKKNRARGINRAGRAERLSYELSLPDSRPGKKRCQRRPRVRSSSLLHVKWQSKKYNSFGIIFNVQRTPTSAGVMNLRVICGYSIFEEPHCGQRITAAAMSGSVASQSTIRLCALSKSSSSTITLAFACGRDMNPTCCNGASL